MIASFYQHVREALRLVAAEWGYVRARTEAGYRFLCPACLRFGGFLHAGAREALPAALRTRLDGAYPGALPRTLEFEAACPCRECRAKGVGLAAQSTPEPCLCRHCGREWPAPALHERRVLVIGVLATDTTRSRSSATRQAVPGSPGLFCEDDGIYLTYLLDLARFPERGSPRRCDALREIRTVWVDSALSGLELARALDRMTRLRPDAGDCLYAQVGPGMMSEPDRRAVELRFREVEWLAKPRE